MSARLGINPIVWSNDDLRSLGGDIPLETCLAEAGRVGYQGIELGHKFPREPEPLQRVLQAHELALVSGWYSSFLLEREVEQELEAAEEHLALLQACGCQVAIVAECSGSVHGDLQAPLSGRPLLDDVGWERLATGLEMLGARCREYGLQLAYHHHMGTVIQTEAEIDQLMELTGGAVGLLLDTGHLVFAGGDPLATAQRHARRIAHVHAKDLRADCLQLARDDDWSFLKAVPEGVFTVPGDGMVDFLPILKVLAASGYAGWLVVEAEQDPAKAIPLDHARLGFASLSRMAARAGLRGARAMR